MVRSKTVLRVGLTLLFVAVALTAAQPPGDPKDPKAAKKFPDAEAHRPTPYPDRVILTWKTDPATSQAVSWRTAISVDTPVAEVAVAEGGPGFAGYKAKAKSKATRVAGTTTPLVTDLGPAHYHSVNFEGLSPATLYVYRVGDGVHWSEWFQFRTASPKAEPFTFLYVGDAQNDVKSHWSRVIRQAVLDAPEARLIVHAGDLINSANKDAEWGEWFTAAGWVNGSIPSVPTPGNHEWYDRNARQKKEPPAEKAAAVADGEKKAEPDVSKYHGTVSKHWRPQFALPENGPEGQEELAYWFDFQGVRFVSLNSNESKAKSSADKEKQAAWLDGVLADNPNRWTVVTFHHPVYSPAKKRDNPDLRKLWQPIFDKYRVDLVLTGHDHTYARSGLTVANDGASGGTTVQVGGTVYCVSVSGPKMYELAEQDWMVTSANDTQLYQIVRVDGDRLRYEAHTATGELYDLFELHKQADGRNVLVERAALEAKPAWYTSPVVWGPAAGAVGLAVAFLGFRGLFGRGRK